MNPTKQEAERCSGYLRKAHSSVPVLYLQNPDGTREALCRVCANRWLLSDNEWGPPIQTTETQKPWPEDKEPSPNHY